MIRFTVFGKPEPAGSKRAFVIAGRATVSDANKKSRPWKTQVSQVAAANYSGTLLRGPLRVTFRFYAPRPKGHFGAKGLNKKGREAPFPTGKPDALKLARGVEDALTGVIYKDDSQIVQELLHKEYGEPSRVEIEIEELQGGE